MSRFHLTRGRRRTATRAFVLATAVTAIAPLAASTTANAADSHRPWRGAMAHHQRPDLAALKSQLQGKARAAALAHRGTADAEPGFVRSQFPARGQVAAMLQLSARPAARVFVSARPRGTAAATTAAREQRATIASLTRSVQSHFSESATAARTLFTVRNVYAGIAVRTDVSRLAALARIPGVTAVHPLPTYHLTNSSTVPLVGAPNVWSDGGNLGENVKIGIIDTGIDYTHANFGGTGSSRAYDADHAVADSPTLNVPTGDYPSSKVVGGIDLAGDGYDASSSDPAVATPHTDPNPLDCNGHGSHVAGSAAGLGVAADGSTFDGDYTALSGLSTSDYRAAFRIGPGVAPGADLYGIRVFGCDGSTNLVVDALDWAADPNGDGNMADHLDIVNMSLGSDFGVPDDSDAEATNNASLLGITVVTSAGNGGDTQAIAGTPANASRAISVAATNDEQAVLDAMQENSPVSQKVAGQRNVLFNWRDSGPTTGDVVAVDPTFVDGGDMRANNADGCEPFTPAQAAAVAGKIAWEEWTDGPDRACGSFGRAENAYDAGAIGVILTDDAESFTAGINGAVEIPTFQIRNSDSDALRSAAQGGTLNVTLTNDLRNSYTVVDPTLTDQVADFSSRGWGANNSIKPDLAAPGVSVFSTAVGTGNEGTSESGTSMAAPHTAGMAALVKAAHPSWFPEQIKAALMNTANNDVTSPDGEREAPDRVGAGRAQVDRAVATDVLAYSFGTGGGVGLSFGMPEVKTATTMTRLFKVENNTGSDQAYDLGYVPANDGTQPNGVTYSFPQPSITVPAHSTITVPVQMDVDPSQLDRPIDTTRSANDPVLDWPNYYVPEASGWVTLNQGGEALRLPLYAAPRATSDVHATDDSLSFAGQGVAPGVPEQWDFSPLSLTGSGFNTDSYQSLIAGFELGATSPEKPDCGAGDTDLSQCTGMPSLKSSDIQYVGATSDYSALRDYYEDPFVSEDSMTYFAVSAFGPWRSPVGFTEYDVNIDTNNDGNADYILFNWQASGSADDAVAVLIDLDGNILDLEYLNNVSGAADSNAFDNDAMVLPVWSNVLDAIAPSGQLNYWVDSFDIYSGFADETAPASFDFHNAGLAVSGDPTTGVPAQNAWNESFSAIPLYWVDDSSNNLLAVRDKAAAQADGTQGLLLLHMNNPVGQTAEVLGVGDSTQTALTLNRSTAQYSQKVKATVEVTSLNGSAPPPGGRVQLKIDGKVVRTHTLNSLGKTVFTLPRLNARSAKYSVVAGYLGDGVDNPSESGPVLLKVVKQTTTTTVTASKAKPAKGTKDVFTATVKGSKGTSAVPTGTVQFFRDGKAWGNPVKLVNGVASKSETNFARGSHTVRAVYSGNKNQKSSSGSTTITVV